VTSLQRPRQVSEYALVCLQAIAADGLGQHLSLGGAFGLAHYSEYRTTHDVDAWWIEPASQEIRRRVVSVLEEALRRFGSVRTRTWGDVVSVELSREGKTVFSFQIARRSAELQAPVPGPWPGGILVDSFEDLVASKMVALVERGAPRDFRDIYTLCESRRYTVMQCWELWQTRQQLAGENDDRQRALIAVQTHLARIEQARPLNQIGDVEEQEAAEKLRKWFQVEFLH
jgi:hypothetical protein